MANGFNDFFLTLLGISIIQFLKHQYYLSSILKIIPILTLSLGLCNLEEIVEIIKSLENKKTVDIDNLSSNLLKAVAFEISAFAIYFF